jgi:hypothetical protein
MRIPILLVLAVGACAGDEVDMGNGPVCTAALYDACTTEHDCLSNDCHTFAGDGFQACTQPCSAAMPCPAFEGAAVECNTNGICKPPMARACRVVP